MSELWKRPTPTAATEVTPDHEQSEAWRRPTLDARDPLSFEATKFYREWERRVKHGGANDYIICVTPSSKTGVSGTGKTTCATVLAKELDVSEEGFDAEKKATLDAGDLAYDVLPEVGEGSALIFDEAQGAPGTDSLNSRRGMKSESIDAINAILANRDLRVTLIIVGQQLGMLDNNIYPMLDAWFLIRYQPDHSKGPLLTHHKLHSNDYELKNPQLRTPAVEDLTWPALSADDPDYQVMERKKQEAKRKRSPGDEESGEPSVPQALSEMPTKHRDAIIKDLRRNHGVEREDLADAAGVSAQRISQIAPLED